jgi:hypothetical protein
MQRLLSDQFVQSYLDHSQYPCNVIPQNTKAYSWDLSRQKEELERLIPRLCLKKEGGADLPIRDIRANSGRSNGWSIQSK